MSSIILHHYPMSPFAEKARAMLGFKQLAWHSVTIPSIMPKPDVIALTGGYRRTPIMQIGCDVYCDTALMAQVLECLHPLPALVPLGEAASIGMQAAWADSMGFAMGVSYAMQPAGLANMFAGAKPENMAAFAADRKAFREGASIPRVPLEAGTAILHNLLAALDVQLSDGRAFLHGSAPDLVDFCLYNPLWFIARAKVDAVIQAKPLVSAWLDRIAAIGHGKPEAMTSEATLAVCAAATPAPLEACDDPLLGQQVAIAATDYGIDPSTGKLVGAYQNEWVIERHDPRAGRVHVHFPRMGFALKVV